MSNRPTPRAARRARYQRNKPRRGRWLRPATVNQDKDRSLHGKARVRARRAAQRAERES